MIRGLKRGSFLKDKKGEEVLTPIIIFVILNLAFFSILFVFLAKSTTGALVYEEAYAKQIAMLIDAAEPEPSTVIWINFQKGVEIAKDNNLNLDNLVYIDNDENQVIVNLGKTKGGYGVRFFSDYDISFYREGNKQYIVINKEKEQANA